MSEPGRDALIARFLARNGYDAGAAAPLAQDASFRRYLRLKPSGTKPGAVLMDAPPAHEDARYYLGHCLAVQGDVPGALAQYEELTRLNPQSHRGFARLGTLRAMTARSRSDLAAAEAALDRAHRLNPEETGALLALGEVALMRNHRAIAAQPISRKMPVLA